MACGAQLLWCVVILGCVLIPTAQGYDVVYGCNLDTTNGVFAVQFKEAGTTFGGTIQLIDDKAAGTLCTLAPIVASAGASPNVVYSFSINVLLGSSSGSECGVQRIGTSGNIYELTIVSQSMPSGFVLLDKFYTMQCDFDAMPSIDNNAISAPAVTVGTTPTKENPFAIEIQKKNPSAGFDKLLAATAVTFSDDLKIQITLDRALAGASTEFFVHECVFKATRGSVVEAKFVKAYAGPKYCVTKNALAVGFADNTHGFTYAAVASPASFTGTSTEFKAFSLLLPGTSGVAMTLTCTMEMCGGTCNTALRDCSATAVTKKRRRRAVDQDPKTMNIEATITVMPEGYSQTSKSQGNGGSSDCEAMSNMGYVVGLIVLAAMLVLTVATTIFMFTRLNRRRDDSPNLKA